MTGPRTRIWASLVIAVAMVVTSAVAYALKPTIALAERLGKLELESAIPTRFGDWVEETRARGAVVNPQQQAVIDAIYSDTLSRTYVNSRGERVMLSVAYGVDQRDGLQVHKPEVCYPAQGFSVQSIRKSQVEVEGRSIPVKRVQTRLGQRRIEPVTYWMTVGETVVLGGLDKKLAEMRYSFDGVYPDGLLFRVSTIDADANRAFSLQDRFLHDIVAALDPKVRDRIAGSEQP
ncbi:MAG: EpsI family protein [Porticoccaceae bacterium]|nr:EpsI family protein [Porticoccaceae bacterium]